MFHTKDLQGFLQGNSAQALTSDLKPELPEAPQLLMQDDLSCKICGIKFNILFGIKRFHCKFCCNSVCSDHSLRRRQKGPDTARICDLCDEDCIKNELKADLVSEIWTLENQLTATHKDNDCHREDDIRQQDEIRRLKEELATSKLYHQQALDAMRQKHEIELKKSNRIKNKIEELQTHIKQSSADEKKLVLQTQTRSSDFDANQADLTLQSQALKLLESQDKLLDEQLSDRLNMQTLYNMLCDECLNAVELL